MMLPKRLKLTVPDEPLRAVKPERKTDSN